MKPWEYVIDRPNGTDYDLAVRGTDGWELAAAKFGDDGGIVVAVFKREKVPVIRFDSDAKVK